MKKQMHLQTRILFTLFGLTAAILVTVGLAFNLSIRGYLKNRVTTQLRSVRESASSDRKNPPPKPEKRFDGRPDRITGTTGNAVVLHKDGSLVSVFHGDREAAKAVSAYFALHGVDPDLHYRVISLDTGKYAVSVSPDPSQKDNYIVSYVDVTTIMAFTARINAVLLVIILAALLLSVFLSRRLAGSLARPVQELSLFAGEIGSGNFETREMDFKDLEFGQLADSMNLMAQELHEAKQKQEIFFQNVSHELRTPLTSIHGNAEGIVYGLMEPVAAAKVIVRESDKLGGMVEDVLYLSRAGKQSPESPEALLDLREVLSLCVSEHKAEAESKGVDFDFDFDEEPVLMSIREQDAERLFGNLISNAIRYAKSKVTLYCHTENETVVARVSDDGDGISPEDLPHVFERFYKGKGGRHGIGLAIAQSVTESCHGTITARNEGGAVFEVAFPTATR